MIERQPNNRHAPAVVDMDLLVPKFHLLRKIEKSMDWDKIYGLVEHLYSKNVGRPSVDPVVLIKIVLLQHLYGHRSLRQVCAVCEDSIAYRWFLGYGLLDNLPHFSTVSYNFLHRFGSDVFEAIFTMVLEQAIDSGYVKPEVIFVDGTHIKANADYKTPWIFKQIFDDGRIPSLPYKRPMTKKGNLPWYEYVYDEYYDCAICPEYKVLNYSTTNRDGYREYKSRSYICQGCAKRDQCTQSKNCQKTVTRHIWADYLERAEDVRHSPLGQETYSMRSRTIERVFADAKEKHGMRYTTYRGLSQVTNVSVKQHNKNRHPKSN